MCCYPIYFRQKNRKNDKKYTNICSFSLDNENIYDIIKSVSGEVYPDFPLTVLAE